MDSMDWRWLRSFVAVAEAGGMHSAAAQLRTSQATLSRHVSALEEVLDVVLFDRTGRGVRLSPEGAALLERARAVQESVKAFELQAQGLSEEEGGSVRVTMSRRFGIRFAPPWIAGLRRVHPKVVIDLVLENTATNLLLREAEVAVRLFRPTQLELVAKRCGSVTRGFFASAEYLARRGEPRTVGALREHDLIGFDRVTEWIDAAQRIGEEYTREDFVCRTDDHVVHTELACQHMGIAVLPEWFGRRAGLVQVLLEASMPGEPIFLVAHREVHRTPRVAKVWAHLGAALEDAFG
ncbi:MAG: LysR family transcriptional regulator [Myxococcota bacterium]